jgi:hypothetical protein
MSSEILSSEEEIQKAADAAKTGALEKQTTEEDGKLK